MAFRTQKISQMTPKGSDLEATDLIEVSTIESGSYVTRSITGQELIDAIPAPTGFVPTSRTLTINGTTQDLSADRTFTISTGITIGTTAITSGTVGRVMFQGTGNVVQQSSSLFWDSTNNRLGIGTSSPSHKLSVFESNSSEIVSARFETTHPTLNYIYLKSAHSANHFIQTNAGRLSLSADENGTNGVVSLRTNNITALTVTPTQNVLINTGTDAGFRLDVNGTARVSGIMRSNEVFIRGGTATTNVANSGFWVNGGQAPTVVSIFRSFFSDIAWVPSSGPTEFSAFEFRGTINQTGTANGITRGFYVNPTLPSAFDFRAIETTNGKVIFGNLPTSSAGLPTGAIWNDAGTLKIV